MWDRDSRRALALARATGLEWHAWTVHVVEDPVEARRRIQHFQERAGRRDAYGELLARGQVSRGVNSAEERDALRRALRAQARADKLKIITRAYGDVVVALLNRPVTRDREAEMFEAMRETHAAADVANRLGHQHRVLAREHREFLALCMSCNAQGHVRASTGELEIAGALYTDACLD